MKTHTVDGQAPQMSLLGHVKELRTRLLVSVVALAVTTFASFAFSSALADFLAQPIGGLQELQAIDVTENISVFMKISLLSGLILALPVILYEVLAFVVPGLNPNERKWIWLVIPTATVFFVIGVAFAYFVMMPAALPFLLNFMGITTAPRPNNYFSFVLNLMFWVGVSFELPLVIYVLARLRIISAKDLLRQWRIAIVAIAILAAVITPTPDPVNMSLMMLPLMALYLLSILFARFARRDERTRRKLTRGQRWLVFLFLILSLALVSLTLIFWSGQIREFLLNIGRSAASTWAWLNGLLGK